MQLKACKDESRMKFRALYVWLRDFEYVYIAKQIEVAWY